MSKPIYNLFLVRRATERFLRLARAKQDALLGQVQASLAAAGGRSIITCDASWCNEGYRAWGVEEFPDLAAMRQHAAEREKLEWYSYLEGWSILGTWHEAVNPADCVAPEPGRIYQLFLYRYATEAQEQLSQEERDALWAQEDTERPDSKPIVAANCYWASEEYEAFGVLMHPDIDAVQRHFAHLEQISWPRYTRARTLLGTLWGE
jgi:hypothetical protein